MGVPNYILASALDVIIAQRLVKRICPHCAEEYEADASENDIIKYIDREIVKKEEVVKFVENCPIPKDIVDQHNAAARLNKMIEEGKK